jgi:uncharacterized protein involved in type VI secretion and phage assembly
LRGEWSVPEVERFDGNYRAVVVDNNDPDTSGRVKLRVYPMMEDLEEAVLPWALPAFPLWEGGKSGEGSYVIPDVGAHVWVFFEAGSPLHPVYFAAAPAKTHGPSGKNKDKKTFKSRTGHIIEVSDVSGSEAITVTHKDGTTKISMDSTGKVEITSKADMTLNATGKVEVKATGDVTLNGGGLVANGKVVTTLHICSFTGAVHTAGSANVKATL